MRLFNLIFSELGCPYVVFSHVTSLLCQRNVNLPISSFEWCCGVHVDWQLPINLLHNSFMIALWEFNPDMSGFTSGVYELSF